ncbi:MAG: 2-oxoacid:ferredoxin oxidoreductase subunit beta [Candidatus Marinimicrobia bacterium]|nr:2-oxoacid:ferredoxin oxidoreductase subunit beta [Candidatus Neomarinimicrobiota bacterium]
MEKNIKVPTKQLTRMDFTSDQTVKWCPGCGDYSVLAQVQRVMPDLGIPKENFVIVSGIGCSSRFPYYMNTYGFHGIHGRASAIATGMKLSNPDLSIWIVTGDGDSLSIGGNHFIHLLRRNIDVNMLLFNNRIYGLTKGQYSPTSPLGKVTKSTPMGSLDHPFNPPALALGAHASFVARTIDKEPKHMQEMIRRSHQHHGTSFLEIYQNCLIFNDGEFASYTDKEVKHDNVLVLEHGQPMIFGKNRDKGIHLAGNRPRVVNIGSEGQWTVNDLLVHDEKDWIIASILSHFTYREDLPTPVGVFYAVQQTVYEDLLLDQCQQAVELKGAGDLHELMNSGDTWIVK